MIQQKDIVNIANELGITLMQIRNGRNKARNNVREIGFSEAVGAVCSAIQDSNRNFDDYRFKQAVAWRAATGKLVKVGQRNFDVHFQEEKSNA